MKVLLSPAKSLDFEKEAPTQEFSTALFLKQSEKINKILRKKKPKDLSELMDISDKLAQLNWERNQQWQVPFPAEQSKSAIYAFNGDVYEGFDPLTAKDIADVVYFAVTRPAHVNINDLTIMPAAQASATVIDKNQ